MARDDGEEDVDDLARVLGYRGAVDDRRGVTKLAPDLLVVPFWQPDFCAAVVRAAQLVGFAPDPDDPVPGHEVSLAAITPRLYQAVQDDLGSRIWPQLRETWPLIEYHGLRDAFVIRYALGEQEELRQHHDVAQISGSVKLDEDHGVPSSASRARASTTGPCRWGRCSRGRRWSPIPTRQHRWCAA